MKILCDYQGWVKLPRVIFKTRVWNDSAAFRIYAALLASATHMDVLETVNGIPVRLRPGQLTATQSEICGITGYSRKIVRNGLGVLAAERIVSSHCAPDRRFSIVTVHSPPYSMKGLEVSAGQPGPIDFAKSGQSFPGDNIHNEGEFTFAAELSGAECQLENGPTSYRNKEYKESKNEKNILFPSSSVTSILSLWRCARERAGEPYCEDPVTLEGAALMAELWLDTGKATEPTIAGAMARFVHTVKTNEAARLYTLKTLANSFGSYLEKPPETVFKHHAWTFTCDVCGYTTASFHRDDDEPKPYLCRLNPNKDCTGTMIPKRD